jgi:hypothetical protein
MTAYTALGWAEDPGELVQTPNGPGKYVAHKNGRVVVEHDYAYLVEYAADEVTVGGEEG